MLCFNCSKLNYMYTNKSCLRCQADVFTNIAVICDRCSSTEKTCAACLKKTDNFTRNKKNTGCRSCGS